MLRICISWSCALAFSALSLPAQGPWSEVGDAGDLPASAQGMHGSIFALPAITGTLGTPGDVDMYWIDIVSPAAFSATTVGGTSVDTQLWLFLPDGRGVVYHDGVNPSLQSTISGANVPAAGTYLLAISAYNADALAAGDLLWADFPYDPEQAPNGPRRLEAVDAWSSSGFQTGAYTIGLTGCRRTGREIVLPDNHHLTESATQTAATGSVNWWRTGGGRFQILYEASHFTAAGATLPFFIDGLMFRGEDGEPNRGGQTWSNVTVQLAASSLVAATLSTDFAANLAASVPLSNPITYTTVTVGRSLGSTPNNYNIILNLKHPGTLIAQYAPASSSLLIDVRIGTAATEPAGAGPVMEMQDTSGTAVEVRGAGVTSPNPVAATGTLSTNPLVVGLKVNYFPFGPAPTVGAMPLIPARTESIGAGCGGAASSFYQSFVTGQAFDLTGLTLTPNNPTAPSSYSVTGTAPPFDASQVNPVPNSTDDGGTVPHALGFTFAFPGGTTSTIRATTDGYAWLSGALGADYSVTLAEFLATQPRLAPFWYDFHAGRNSSANPNAGMHVRTAGVAPNRVCYVTWLNVGEWDVVAGAGISGHGVYDMQLAIFETTNVVQFRYGAMPRYTSNDEPGNPSLTGIVGFSRGAIGGVPSVDPQSRDLSLEVPFATAIEGAFGAMGQRVTATPDSGGIQYGGRAYAGQALRFDAVNVPPGTTIGLQLLDFACQRPGASIPGIHGPGCINTVSLAPFIHEVFLLPGASVTGNVPLVIPPGVDGFQLYAQFVTLDLGGATLAPVWSNAMRATVGRD